MLPSALLGVESNSKGEARVGDRSLRNVLLSSVSAIREAISFAIRSRSPCRGHGG